MKKENRIYIFIFEDHERNYYFDPSISMIKFERIKFFEIFSFRFLMSRLISDAINMKIW